MGKKDKESLRLYINKERDRTVGFGKYKDKKLQWVAKEDIEYFKQIESLYYEKYDIIKKEYYNSLKKKYITNNGLSAIHHQDKVQEIVSLMRQKQTSIQLHSYLKEKHNCSHDTTMRIMMDANSLVRHEFELDRKYIVDIHMMRYEQLYESNINPDLEKVPPGYRKAVLCEHYINAMETLFQKEKLLGIHTKKFKLKINSLKVNEHKGADFNMSSLSLKEQLEVISLLNKAKPIEKLVRDVIKNDNPLDISEAIVIDEDVIESPIKAAKQTDEIGDNEAKVEVSTGKSLFEVNQLMKKNLEDKVKELFEKKNK
jgi:hypothetical protein